MGDGGRRSLSDLPDDLLRRILFFAPTKEAASTSVLSRRWCSLWRSSGAVNLDTRSFSRRSRYQEDSSKNVFRAEERDAFLGGADKALAAAQRTVRRLTFFVARETGINLTRFDGRSQHDLVAAVVTHPAARRVEELQIVNDDINNAGKLGFGSLPSEALQVLRIVKLGTILTEPPPPAGGFPRLVDLHLEGCTVHLSGLQRTVGAAPQLSRLHLQRCWFVREKTTFERRDEVQCYRLRCPAVAHLVFAGCKSQSDREKISLELDMPRLQHLRYEGDVQRISMLSLKPQASPNLIRVELHLDRDYHYRSYGADDPTHVLFWQFLQSFSTTKLLKIKLDFSMDLVAIADDNESKEELLGSLSFCLLERLELEGTYDPKNKTSMVMLGNLLHCCPILHYLQVKLRKILMPRMPSFGVDQEARVEFGNSVKRFRRHHIGPMVSLGGEDDDTCYDQAFDIPGLSDLSFTCLQSYLRRVSLHFCMNKPSCLEVQLAKFFAEKAMVLEEMYIDDGSQKFCEHMNPSLRRWIGNSAIRRSSGVKILPQ